MSLSLSVDNEKFGVFFCSRIALMHDASHIAVSDMFHSDVVAVFIVVIGSYVALMCSTLQVPICPTLMSVLLSLLSLMPLRASVTALLM